jgi:hypothetical protein
MQHHDAQCALLEHARAASAAFTAARAMMATRTAPFFVFEQAAAMMPTVVALVLGAVAGLAGVIEQMLEHGVSFLSGG